MENGHDLSEEQLAAKELILELHWRTAVEKTRYETREFISQLSSHPSKEKALKESMHTGKVNVWERGIHLHQPANL